VEEFYVFIALTLLMPRVKKVALAEYWSSDEYLKTNMFSLYMPRTRFYNILSMLNFNDNEQETPGTDPLVKLQLVVDHLREKYSQVLRPFQTLAITEGLLLNQDGVYSTYHIANKTGRMGLRSFILCCCETGFIVDFTIYASKNKNSIPLQGADIGLPSRIVTTIMRPYLLKGHTLLLSGWLSSLELFNYLHERGTNVFGVIKKDAPGIPSLESISYQGDIKFRTCNNLCLMKCFDKEEVLMLSTCHNPDMVDTKKTVSGEAKLKPQIVVDYNTHMRVLDHSNVAMSSISSIIKANKWYTKYFFYLIDLSVHNAYIMFQHSKKSKMNFPDFQLQLTKDLIGKFGDKKVNKRSFASTHSQDTAQSRLVERHFPAINRNDCGKKMRRRCVVCHSNKISKQSQFECKDCNVGLCVDPCFKTYHTKKDYKK